MRSHFAKIVLAMPFLGSACTELPVNVVELSPNTLSQDLVAHYRFDDAQGNTVHDSSGNLRDGVLTGGQWLSDGRFGGALRLGSDEFATVGSFPYAQSKFSVSAWVRINSYTQDTSDLGQWGTVVSTELGLTGGWEVNVDHQGTSPVLDFGLWKGPNVGDYDKAQCACLPLGTWTQVAAVVDDTVLQLSLYVDGTLIGTSKMTKGILPGSTELTIGQWPSGGRFLLGDVDDIAIWNRTLVADEIAELNQQPVTDP